MKRSLSGAQLIVRRLGHPLNNLSLSNLKGTIARLVHGITRIASSPVGIASAVTRYGSTTTNARHNRLLLIIVVIGFLLRVSTILWGVPVLPFVGIYHPDEHSTYSHALYFPQTYGIETNFVHGSTLPYLMAALLSPVKAMITFEHWDTGLPYRLKVAVCRCRNSLDTACLSRRPATL